MYPQVPVTRRRAANKKRCGPARGPEGGPGRPILGPPGPPKTPKIQESREQLLVWPEQAQSLHLVCAVEMPFGANKKRRPAPKTQSTHKRAL